VPIIAMTAHVLPQTKADCLAAGMDDYVAKPVTKPDLLAAVARWAAPDVAVPDLAAPDTTAADMTVPPASTEDVVVIDEEQLAELMAAVRPTELKAIAACFLSDIAARINRLDGAIARQDLRAIASEAHDLSSTAGSFGATGVMQQATQLEVASRTGNLTLALASYPTLAAATRALIAVMEARFAKL
jgi:HPt (histidine-containing phosphotransfer) domain-containing protein